MKNKNSETPRSRIFSGTTYDDSSLINEDDYLRPTKNLDEN